MVDKKLYRSNEDRILAGICGGIAEYIEMDPTIVRLITVILMFVFGSGLIIYLIAWVIIPENPYIQ